MKDVDHWDEQPYARQFMLFAAMAWKKPEWFDLWKMLNQNYKSNESRISQSLKNPILWIDLKNNNLKK
jgi:hypothetical protein